MRAIDADAFKSEGRELYREAGWDLREVHYSQLDVECNIDMMPTIEAEPNSCGYWDSESHFCALRRPQAEPVKHGRWIKERVHNLHNGEKRNARECSECGARYFIYDTANAIDEVPRYCPNCGADMREVEE